MQMKHCVHLHRHDMLTVPLTVLLHHPITSMTGDCPISAQIRLVITNQVWEYYFVIVLINNGNRTQWSSIWSVIIWVIDKIRWPRSGSPICQSRLWLPAELDETKFCYQLIITIIIKKKKTFRTNISIRDNVYSKKFTANCPITLSDYNCTEWLVKYKAADAPITFEEIVMVIIISLMGLEIHSYHPSVAAFPVHHKVHP